MIEGIFRADEPTIVLTLAGRTGRKRIPFLVDTGFQGSLALSEDVLREIGAEFVTRGDYQLADGSPREFTHYLVAVEEAQDMDRQTFHAIAKDGSFLLGLDFMREHLLQVEVTEGGAVVVEPL